LNLKSIGVIAVCGILVAACHPFRGASCHAPKEYERAEQRPLLRVPDGLDVPNAQGALTIPGVKSAEPRSATAPCLEEPPLYRDNAAKSKAASPKK
jgi:uncharacterized lipoprotein